MNFNPAAPVNSQQHAHRLRGGSGPYDCCLGLVERFICFGTYLPCCGYAVAIVCCPCGICQCLSDLQYVSSGPMEPEDT
ncbi:hypothetical protein BGW80DRAFT_1419799 [Lactifluus volemus]|nr:hypothetical protein BGW80DRAFT_1419799 [Lactifluus volemus]